MKHLSKSYSSQNNSFILLWILLFGLIKGLAQQGNLISNGSFEVRHNCEYPHHVSLAKSWNSIDSSIHTYAGVYRDTCNGKVPYNGSGFQYARTGSAYILTGMYCLLQNCGRGYMKNRLAATLKQGKTYCVKFCISIANESPRGMDGFGIYFGDGAMDTIKHSNIPLTYINPQVKNPIGNVITDTLNWTAITGTFVANGTEKYALIGNFLADNAVTTASINTPSYPQYWTDVYVDDVSCVEVDLAAYAGPDKSVKLGDSVYIGRENDFAIDSGCTWYQLPNLTTPIKKVSGLWVKPVATTTYVVRQTLECSAEKWDTVVVYTNLVGLDNQKLFNTELTFFPVPAKDFLEVTVTNQDDFKDFHLGLIYNSLGQIVNSQEISFKDQIFHLELNNLQEGVYSLVFKNKSFLTVSKRFIIAK